MNTITLSMRYSDQPQRELAAWFLPGADPMNWIAQAADCGIVLDQARLYVVSQGPRGGQPLGVLLLSGNHDKVNSPAQSEGHSPSRHGNPPIPYGCLAGKLYLPLEGLVSPLVTDSELSRLFPADCEALIWHPIAGLIGFEPGDRLSFGQLLLPPVRVESQWDRAQPGSSCNHRLRSVTPTIIPTVEFVLEQGQDDIGSQAQELSDLPPAPNETTPSPLGRALAGAASTAAGLGQWLLSRLPRQGTGASWIDRASEWLSGAAQRAAQRLNLLSKRERELKRLLHLLESAPDQGLKYALPLAGDAHRGAAPPSDRLGERSLDFDLRRLGTGGSADPWFVSNEMHQALRNHYLRLAERELRLGRYRRAAYILAQLLGDFAGAAAALQSGSHFREAAILYRDRLKQPAEAAACLERGGLWAEALDLYRQLEQFEKAGDLARRLEQEDEADSLFRQAVESHRGRGDLLSAARILEDKLNHGNEALECLLEGWTVPHPQFNACLKETFSLLSRLGQHDQARRHLERLTGPGFPSTLYYGHIRTVADVATSYPDPEVRACGANVVQTMVANQLATAPPAAAGALLAGLMRLIPGDRLLARDCGRFMQPMFHGKSPARMPPRPTGTSATVTLQTDRPFPLPEEWRKTGKSVECLAAVATDWWYYLAGRTETGEIFVLRGVWSEAAQHSLTVSDAKLGVARHELILLASSNTALPVVVHVVGQPSTFFKTGFAPIDRAGRPIAAGSPPWATADTLSAARSRDAVVWVLDRLQRWLVVNGYSHGNVPCRTQPLPLAEEQHAEVIDPPVLPIPFLAHDSRFFVGLGEHLVIVPMGNNFPTGKRGVDSMDADLDIQQVYWAEPEAEATIPMPNTIRRIACSTSSAKTRIALTLETGGCLISYEPGTWSTDFLCDGLETLAMEFIDQDCLVVATTDRCLVYSTQSRPPKLTAEGSYQSSIPVAVLCSGKPNEFGIAFTDGRVRSFRIQFR